MVSQIDKQPNKPKPKLLNKIRDFMTHHQPHHSTQNQHIDGERLNQLADIANQYVSNKQSSLLDFMMAYYHSLYHETAAKYSNDDLAGMALHHYMMLTRYQTGQPQIAVINPVAEAHHFHSSHTVIQIVAYDRPFLVDTMTMTLEEQGINVHRIHNTIMDIQWDNERRIQAVSSANTSHTKHMSLIHIEIDRQDTNDLSELEQTLLNKVGILDTITNDWQQMHDRLQHIKNELSQVTLPDDYHSYEEIEAFLSWILNDHFIFLGFREYRLEQDEHGGIELITVGGSGLGLLRTADEDKPSASFKQLPEQLKQLLILPKVLLLSKSSQQSPVHRPVYMDFLGIHKFDDKSNVVGEYRFIGLLTSQAYQLSVQQIPLLREKATTLLDMAQLPKHGHAHQKMMHIINTLPRDDLFQGDTDELYPIVTGILQLQDKHRLRLFARVDHYQRFVSCLVYIPRDKFNTMLRIKIQKVLVDAFGGTSSGFSTQMNEAYHARVHVHVRTIPGQIKHVDISKLEHKLSLLMQDWSDGFAKALLDDLGENQANGLLNRYKSVIPAAYQESFDPRTAVEDIKRLNALSDDNPMQWHLFQSTGDADNELHLKLYGTDRPAILSNVLPILEDFGVAVISANTYEIATQPILWMQEYALQLRHVDTVNLSVVRGQFEDSLQRIWQEEVESDRLNELILVSKLDTYDVVVLRALSRYMLQAKAPFSYDYIVQTLVAHASITVKLVELFHARMSPEMTERESAIKEIQAHIDEQLKQVSSLDEDRIIHWLLDLLHAMLRTNFYQRDEAGKRKDRLSFKFAANAIPHLPEPKPMFEIYVYSPKVEAVHLRGGKVARGGLRWSDRMEDFRTEVLGLVKAQMVKNAVIVPVGSKGGFIVKTRQAGMDREAWLKEGIACYQTFIRGMLDITDNIVDGQIVPPNDTMRHDEDDPYLVVAADKGTASFSDIANALAAEYDFWLDDAFASGGSVGYDHKAMGITARGAWESVKRHFRLMGKDIQHTDEFTVVGIGDMSGDVFGNGMLLSDNTLLQAAFNHLHIFIDPTPDAKISHAERERLFNLPRSSWQDYDPQLISQGGGVFSRQAKSISITDEMKQAFAIEEDSLTPNELIHALLKAPVDLIWNGGIGTYVKASSETHADVGDKANDSLRVNGDEVRAKIIGEGGNLGCTQLGRIEYAQHGGRIYTDAIDNSGGVNCSDHEVNIKILLGDVVKQGDMTMKQRNELLESMTDSVAELVLRQNYLQPQTIELSAYQAAERLNEHQRFMQMLESNGRLDRAIERLPNDTVMAERQKAGKGLTNPEFAILLAYGKMWVYDHLLASDLPDEAYFTNELRKYFPDVLDTPYFEQMTQHRLHREIISTYLTNGLVNRLGIENVFRLTEETGQDITTITRAYAIARDVYDVYHAWRVLEELDNQVAAQEQIRLELKIRQALKQGMAWFINANGQKLSITEMTDKFKATVQQLLADEELMNVHFAKSLQDSRDEMLNAGLSAEQADVFAKLPIYPFALDVVQLAQQADSDIRTTAQVYFAVYDALNVGWLYAQVASLPQQSHWDRRANNALIHELNKTIKAIALPLLDEDDPVIAIKQWQEQNHAELERLQQAKDDLSGTDDVGQVSLSALSVLLSEMGSLNLSS